MAATLRRRGRRDDAAQDDAARDDAARDDAARDDGARDDAARDDAARGARELTAARGQPRGPGATYSPYD
jgi:hypothetical protein